jgi:hypothetical protein
LVRSGLAGKQTNAFDILRIAVTFCGLAKLAAAGRFVLTLRSAARNRMLPGVPNPAHVLNGARAHVDARVVEALRRTDEESRLSEISARLQIQAIYRRFTGNRLFHFFVQPPLSVAACTASLLSVRILAKCKRPAAVVGVQALFLNSALYAIPRLTVRSKNIFRR